MKLIKTIKALAVAGLAFSAASSQAVLTLPAGTPSSPIGGDVALDGAAVTITSLVSPFVGKDASLVTTFTGTLTTTVIQEALGFNALGGYTFVYNLVNDPTSPDTLARLTIDGWKSALPNVVVGNTGPGLDASTADRSANGDNIGFSWINPPGVAVGGFATVFVRTGIKFWTLDNASVIDSGTANFRALAVPEPTTMIAGVLLLLPFGISTLRSLRSKHSA
jgi:hypothetical protein